MVGGPYVQKKESPHLVVERGIIPRALVACRKKFASAALLSARAFGKTSLRLRALGFVLTGAVSSLQGSHRLGYSVPGGESLKGKSPHLRFQSENTLSHDCLLRDIWSAVMVARRSSSRLWSNLSTRGLVARATAHHQLQLATSIPEERGMK